MVCAGLPARAAEWQFAVPTGPKNDGRVFLWIPPACRQVRGIVMAQQVILEKVVLEDPVIRQAAARAGLALALVIPRVIGDYDAAGKGAETLQRILDDLAADSGYPEISRAPLLTLGHSGGAIWAFDTAYWNPDRCLGVIGLHTAPIHPPPYARKSREDGTAMLDDVPVLDITGQYEAWGIPGQPADYRWRWVRGTLLEFRAIGHNALVNELVQPGATHFNWDEALARHVALFIETAARRRLPEADPAPGETPRLRTIPQEAGWLTDLTLVTPPEHSPAPFSRYGGDPTLAFWHLDKTLARATEAYGTSAFGKALQEVTFVQDGRPLPTAWLESLPFHPDPQGDGLTMRVAADFLTATPPEMSHPAQTTLGHAEGPIRFRLFGGWSGGEQVGADRFRIRFDRFQLTRPSGTLMVMAFHPGDTKYAPAEQAAQIQFPVKNTAGAPQAITFAPLPPVSFGPGDTLKLRADSSAGLPVEFCVLRGPAEIDGDTLRCTAIPPRTRFPVAVTVAAYQWGRASDGAVQSAPIVEQTLMIPAPAVGNQPLPSPRNSPAPPRFSARSSFWQAPSRDRRPLALPPSGKRSVTRNGSGCGSGWLRSTRTSCTGESSPIPAPAKSSSPGMPTTNSTIGICTSRTSTSRSTA